MFSADLPGALGHFTAVRDTAQGRGPSRVLADALAGRSTTLLNMGRLAEGAEDGRHSLAMARELGYLAGEGRALGMLGIAALYSGDFDSAVRLTRHQEQLMTDSPGSIPLGGSTVMTSALIEAGDLVAAGTVCAAALARCRDLGDLENQPILLASMADLALRAGRIQDAATHLREGLQIAVRTGDWFDVLTGLWFCGLLCTTTGRHAEAVTVWAAEAVHSRHQEFTWTPVEVRRREEALSRTRQALGPARARAAEDRGAAMSMATAAEYALLLTAFGPTPSQAAPGLGKLTARERELVALVARGYTDAQIASQLYISIRTVRSHLDRIRDKTGCRRRADLTRLALSSELV